MNGRRTMWIALALGCCVLAAPAAAEDQSDRPLDLAAMALAPEDVPAGFFDDYGEIQVPAEAIATLSLDGEAPPAGLERTYQSFYSEPVSGAVVHAYLLEFASPDLADAGVSLADALLRPPLPDGDTIGPFHAHGPTIAGSPSTTTVVAFDTREEGGPYVDVVALTFRRGALVAGISLERPGDGLAQGVDADGVPDPAQARLAEELATTLDARIDDVLAGDDPRGTDRTLAGLTLPIDQLATGAVPVLGGYKAGIDLLRCGICGEENALAPFADTTLGGYARTVVVGPLVDGEPQPPFVAVAVTRYASAADALAVLEAIRRAPGDRPTPGPVPRGTRTLAAEPVIPGTDAVVAFHAAIGGDDPDAVIDSAGVDFVVGDRLVTIDVQGGMSGDDAMAVAIDLATQQASCLGAESCQVVRMPAALATAVDAQ